jgi:hypothetical protein
MQRAASGRCKRLDDLLVANGRMFDRAAGSYPYVTRREFNPRR